MRAQRIFAYIIDAILIGIVSSILCAITGFEIRTLWTSDFGIYILYNPVTLLTLGVAALYFLTDVMSAGSPGKKMLGLAVTQNSDEKDLFPTAITRAVVKVLSIHLLIGVIMFFFAEEHSSLHDKVSGTSVQKKVVVA